MIMMKKKSLHFDDEEDIEFNSKIVRKMVKTWVWNC